MATSYYQQKLAEGGSFEDFVAENLYTQGIVLVNFKSKAKQIAYGENLLGLEIKYDTIMKRTGNLWIEMEERSDPSRPYVRSGIQRADKCWLYGIGDEQRFFIFSKKFLCFLVVFNSYVIEEIGLRTSRGFKLPLEEARNYCDREFVWGTDR